MPGPTTNRRPWVPVAAAAVAAVLVLALVLVLAGGGDGEPGGDATTPSRPETTPTGSVPPDVPAAPVVTVDGTLEPAGDDALTGRLTLTNDGAERIWVPVGQQGDARPRLLPAAAGDGVVDLGWVVPPTPAGVEGVPAVVFRPVEPGATLELEATDAPPPPEALVDVDGEPVTVESYRLCVDAFADDALVAGARQPVTGSATGDVAIAADALDGESTRTCGPTLAA